MTTPEQYFTEHPDVAVLAQQPDGFDFYLELPGLDLDEFRHTGIDIDWTGYSRRIAFNPHFAWGKRRDVVWTGKTTNFGVDKKDAPHRQLCNAEGEPLAIWEIGRYVDAPAENPAPELSRFLPEGWDWQACLEGWRVGTTNSLGLSRYKVLPCEPPRIWHSLGLLHPSEGGGFRRGEPHDGSTCDLLWGDGQISYGVKSYRSGIVGPAAKAWRPHFEKGGES